MNKMKSVRLSTFLRDSILNSVMEEFTSNFLAETGLKTVDQLKQAIVDEGYDIACTLWSECYGSINFEAVPGWALDTNNEFTVAQEGDTSKTFATYVHEGEKFRQNRLPCKSAIDTLVTKEDWDTLFNRKDTLEELKRRHDDESMDLRYEIKPVLESFNTTKQLLETWPSMEKFLPANIADPDKGINLPALSLSRLEEKINGGS